MAGPLQRSAQCRRRGQRCLSAQDQHHRSASFPKSTLSFTLDMVQLHSEVLPSIQAFTTFWTWPWRTACASLSQAPLERLVRLLLVTLPQTSASRGLVPSTAYPKFTESWWGRWEALSFPGKSREERQYLYLKHLTDVQMYSTTWFLIAWKEKFFSLMSFDPSF